MVEVHRTLQEQLISHNLTLPLLSVSLGYFYTLLKIASLTLSLSLKVYLESKVAEPFTRYCYCSALMLPANTTVLSVMGIS